MWENVVLLAPQDHIRRRNQLFPEDLLKKAISVLNEPEDVPRDVDYHFGMQVAGELRDMDPVRKGVLKLQIMELILQSKHSVTVTRCVYLVRFLYRVFPCRLHKEMCFLLLFCKLWRHGYVTE